MEQSSITPERGGLNVQWILAVATWQDKNALTSSDRLNVSPDCLWTNSSRLKVRRRQRSCLSPEQPERLPG